jgi:hypothetical protein
MDPPLPGDFSFIRDEHTRVVYTKTFEAVTNCKAWDYIMNFERDGTWTKQDPIIQKIVNECTVLGFEHTDSSFELCMKEIEYISKKGWNKYYICRNI